MMLLTMVFLLISCQQNTQRSNLVAGSKNDILAKEVSLEIYDFEGLKPFLETSTDHTYVINFWATWCAPCVKELPFFEKLHQQYAGKNVEVILVSLDFPNKYESHLKPFIAKNELKAKIIALDDPNSNQWIPQIDPNWSGAIPATLIYNKDKRRFYEQTFTYEELESKLKKFLK